MQIEYWLLFLPFIVIIAAVVFVRLCYIQDKRSIDQQADKNKTVFFIENKSKP